MSKIKVVPVILCGGSGTRLWPLSRSDFPKQFQAILPENCEKTLFQQSLRRIDLMAAKKDSGLNGIEVGDAIIVANEEHRFLALDQLRALEYENATLILETATRNTAPALTFAAFQAVYGNQLENSIDEDPILVVTPADQLIFNQSGFSRAINDCLAVVRDDNSRRSIAILGVEAITPEVGYGYIERHTFKGPNNEYLANDFFEKPNINSAEKYVASGDYFWNCGIFVLRASTWLLAIKEFCPNVYCEVELAWKNRAMDLMEGVKIVYPNLINFQNAPSISIDYAVIEKCINSNYCLKVIELESAWTDLGAWDAVWKASPKNSQSNVAFGDAILSESKNTLVYSTSRLVCALGIENLVIIETADAVLVSDRRNSQAVKQLVDQLEDRGRKENKIHRKVSRPWGWYDSIDEGVGFKVKRILVNSGASLSLQLHHHRAEHWVVVKGVAKILNGDQDITLYPNQSTYIPKGQLHRLHNPGNEELEIIEVQSGNYLGEDDIIRFEDGYGRK